jgi:ribosome biogenesis protein Nip4
VMPRRDCGYARRNYRSVKGGLRRVRCALACGTASTLYTHAGTILSHGITRMNLELFTHFTQFTRLCLICFWIQEPSKMPFLAREYKIE